MGYLHITNLYKDKDILLFKECYALEKIHGTSAHIAWDGKDVSFFSGGEKHEKFVALFDKEKLVAEFTNHFTTDKVTLYGEAYGGKQQGMSATYGKELKFIVFDVQVGDVWVAVPNAEQIAKLFDLEFVYYTKIPTDLTYVDAERDNPSVQAVRNGMGEGHKREGVVLRPLIEFIRNNGSRVICKHKGESFQERQNTPKVDEGKLEILTQAKQIADEWVTMGRLKNILSHHTEFTGMEHTVDVINIMLEDVKREAEGEIAWSKEIAQQIGKNTAILWKRYIKEGLYAIIENK